MFVAKPAVEGQFISEILFACKEAQKPALSKVEEKRSLFPEDEIDPNIHVCLLMVYVVANERSPASEAAPLATGDCFGPLRESTALATTYILNKNSFIHNRDEGMLRQAQHKLRGTTQIA